jgi:hypothetical protein
LKKRDGMSMVGVSTLLWLAGVIGTCAAQQRALTFRLALYRHGHGRQPGRRVRYPMGHGHTSARDVGSATGAGAAVIESFLAFMRRLSCMRAAGWHGKRLEHPCRAARAIPLVMHMTWMSPRSTVAGLSWPCSQH